ncbi:acetylglutamate kinase [soil metagenome]
MEQIFLIKIGGNIIDNEESLHNFVKQLTQIDQKILIVHGGGKIASELSLKMGLEPKMIEGRRITDAETLQLVTMVYGGLINKKITALMQSYGLNAIGLTGADANIIKAKKREIVNNIDYGFVGDITKVAGKDLFDLLNIGLIPVFAPLTHDGQGQILNTNADTIASALAVGLSELVNVNLIYCFELKGVLSDFEDKNSVINDLNYELYQDLKSKGTIAKGMIPKLDNSFEAIRAGVNKVIIGHADEIASIIKEGNIGTTLSM